MDCIVKVVSVCLKNIKNVKQGKIDVSNGFDSIGKSNILGIYGQNGSGKTAVVESFKLLRLILDEEELPQLATHLICDKQETAEVSFDFLVKNSTGEYFVSYQIILGRGENNFVIKGESLKYRENEKGKRTKELILKDGAELSVRNKNLMNMTDAQRFVVQVADLISNKDATTFVFCKELRQKWSEFFEETELEILNNLYNDFSWNFFVIDEVHHGLHIANLILPITAQTKSGRGSVYYKLNDTMVLSAEMFKTFRNLISQINIVLSEIIPGLTLEVKERNQELMDNGEQGTRFELLSKRGEILLPLRCESSGILKIISVLSTLIAVYNKPNVCVVIDELDAGVFEYLLGEILEILSDSGKGQLFFTSHNLRVLEVLPIANLWFTTTNEYERFIQLTGVRKNSNARDKYIRAVQIGGQSEELYKETDSFKIKTTLIKAGQAHGWKN